VVRAWPYNNLKTQYSNHPSCKMVTSPLMLSVAHYIYIKDAEERQTVQGYCCNLNRSTTIYIACNTETPNYHHRNTNVTINSL